MAKPKEKALGSWSDAPDRIARNEDHLNALETRVPKESSSIKNNSGKGKSQTIELPALDIRTIEVRIIGDTSLIVHHWSEKAMKELLDKQMGNATAGKEKKDPIRDFEESLYRIKDDAGNFVGWGFPSIAFKKCAVAACTSLGKSVTKVAARQAFHVMGELVRIEGEPTMRDDMVRVGIQHDIADIRFRGEFKTWSCTLKIRYNARVVSAAQLIIMLNTGGFAVGVGEWRNEKDGNHGLFHVAKGDE